MLLDNSTDFAFWVRAVRKRNRGSNQEGNNRLPYSLRHCVLRWSASYSYLSKVYQDCLPLDMAAGTLN